MLLMDHSSYSGHSELRIRTISLLRIILVQQVETNEV